LDLISLSPIGEKNFNQWSKKLNNLLTWNTGYSADVELDRGDSRIVEARPDSQKKL
jgi:hypothetical protein